MGFTPLFFFSQLPYCLGKQEMPNNSFEQDAHYGIASFVPLKLGIVGAGPDGPHDSMYIRIFGFYLLALGATYIYIPMNREGSPIFYYSIGCHYIVFLLFLKLVSYGCVL